MGFPWVFHGFSMGFPWKTMVFLGFQEIPEHFIGMPGLQSWKIGCTKMAAIQRGDKNHKSSQQSPTSSALVAAPVCAPQWEPLPAAKTVGVPSPYHKSYTITGSQVNTCIGMFPRTLLIPTVPKSSLVASCNSHASRRFEKQLPCRDDGWMRAGSEFVLSWRANFSSSTWPVHALSIFLLARS